MRRICVENGIWGSFLFFTQLAIQLLGVFCVSRCKTWHDLFGSADSVSIHTVMKRCRLSRKVLPLPSEFFGTVDLWGCHSGHQRSCFSIAATKVCEGKKGQSEINDLSTWVGATKSSHGKLAVYHADGGPTVTALFLCHPFRLVIGEHRVLPVRVSSSDLDFCWLGSASSGHCPTTHASSVTPKCCDAGHVMCGTSLNLTSQVWGNSSTSYIFANPKV